MIALKRHASSQLNDWFYKRKRKPLVMRGARQVGKSTLIREFAREQKLFLAEINLEQQRQFEPIFASLDPERILRELSSFVKHRIDGRCLLFLDEVQATPSALPALRYLYEKSPDIAVIAAGSLLEMVLHRHDFSMPVGRIEYLHLGPMTFEEFLLACGETYLLDQLRQFVTGQEFSSVAHTQLQQKYRDYFFVGGMPEAVAVHVRDKDDGMVSDVHRSILATYRDDIAKYGKNTANVLRLQTVFAHVPGHLATRIKYSSIVKDDRSNQVKSSLEMLALAKVITPIVHSDCNGVPLGAERNLAVFKLLFLDIGLVCNLLGATAPQLRAWPETKLINEGGLAEQVVGQHLLYPDNGKSEPVLYYWQRDGKSQNAEVDYVVSCSDWVVPIEVKSGATGSLRSLHEFMLRKNVACAWAVRFDQNLPGVQEISHEINRPEDAQRVTYSLLSLPLYMAEQLPRLLRELRELRG
jgi:uncharacterized protein